MSKRRHDGLELGNGRKHKKLKTHGDTGRLASDDYHSGIVGIQPNTNNREAGTIAVKTGAQKGTMSSKAERRKLKKEEKKLAGKPLGSTQGHLGQRKSGKIISKKLEKGGGGGESKWKVPDIIGGQMLDLDPIFSLNEEYLLIPYDTAINVHATSTSLLVRRLQITSPDRVSAFAISSNNQNQLYISTSLGIIEKWDWVEGTRLEFWNTLTPIHSLATSNPSVTGTANEQVYTVDRKSEHQWLLTAHRLLGGSEASKTDLATLLKQPQPWTSVKVLDNGRVILVTSGSRVLIGTCNRPIPDSLKDLSYLWREVECPEWITSIDVRLRPYNVPNKGSEKSYSEFHSAVDVAVGTLKGKILIYDDLLTNLIRIENGPERGKANGVSSQRLHWHRTAVLALKWSADGNYVVSGGLETVLVLWQLETGHKQVLPNLSAPIESIVVSPSGPFYCVRLSDNSAMILSTSELEPTFSVAGIQYPTSRKAAILLPFVPSVDAPSQSSLPEHKSCFPSVVNPSNPNHLLLAVPSSMTSRLIPKTQHRSCYLQTFDIASAHQVSKQALTRTKDTILNMGPESNLVEEPNVTHMQISHDAQWLATIDEWLPPRRDLALLAFDEAREAEEQSHRLEIYLKIWMWDDQSKIWALNSRVDNPHSSDSKTVLDLASDPSCASFATIGDDYALRVWKPSVRHRDGRKVGGPDGRALMNWRCRYVTSFEELTAVGKGDQQGAKLVYSPDGSVIAAGYRQSSPSTIYLVDSSTGEIQHTLTSLYSGPLLGLGIVDRYLVVLSHELRVWDLVTEEHTFGFILQLHGLPLEKLVATAHLAIDARHGTFAISLPGTAQISKAAITSTSRIMVFDPRIPKPLFDEKTPDMTTALLPAAKRQGYYAIESTALVRILSPGLSIPATSRQELSDRESPSRGLNNIYGDGNSAKQKAHDTSDDEETPRVEFPRAYVVPSAEEDDAVVVSQERLAEIFDTGSAFALPPVSELFEQIAGLFLRKPTA